MIAVAVAVVERLGEDHEADLLRVIVDWVLDRVKIALVK